MPAISADTIALNGATDLLGCDVVLSGKCFGPAGRRWSHAAAHCLGDPVKDQATLLHG